MARSYRYLHYDVFTDHLFGGNNDDILITGYTIYDANDIALRAILAEWTSSHDYLTRTRNLSNGSGSADRETVDAGEGPRFETES